MQYLLIAHHGTIGTCFCEKLAKFSQENQNESSSVVITIDDNNTANKFWILHWREREFLKKKKTLKKCSQICKKFREITFHKKKSGFEVTLSSTLNFFLSFFGLIFLQTFLF